MVSCVAFFTGQIISIEETETYVKVKDLELVIDIPIDRHEFRILVRKLPNTL